MVAVTVTREREGAVARVTLDRPPLNLMEPGLIAALGEAFDTLAGDPSVRATVVAGAGRAFTGGMDVRVLAGLDVPGAKAFITGLHETIEVVHRAPFPVIAEIHGACLGAGFELALACDLRVAAEGAALGLPEVRVGVPSVIEAALLPAAVGPARAAEMLFTGDAVDAATALAWGLVNTVVPVARLRAATDQILDRILVCAPGAIRLQKELIVRWRQTDLRAAIQAGIDAFAVSCASGEAAEGARAFLEKRRPHW